MQKKRRMLPSVLSTAQKGKAHLFYTKKGRSFQLLNLFLHEYFEGSLRNKKCRFGTGGVPAKAKQRS